MATVGEHITYRVVGKRGAADCAVAALAMALRRDYEAVLIAAAHVKPTVWTTGLHSIDIVRIAKRLGVKAKWLITFDPEDSRGLLWVSYRDSLREHCVFFLDGWVFELEDDPVSVWDYEEYCTAQNAYGTQLLKVD